MPPHSRSPDCRSPVPGSPVFSNRIERVVRAGRSGATWVPATEGCHATDPDLVVRRAPVRVSTVPDIRRGRAARSVIFVRSGRVQQRAVHRGRSTSTMGARLYPEPGLLSSRRSRVGEYGQAARRYSWISPPRTSTRSTRASGSVDVSTALGTPIGTGTSSPMPRCGRPVL
jgi:hypothetical protein